MEQTLWHDEYIPHEEARLPLPLGWTAVRAANVHSKAVIEDDSAAAHSSMAALTAALKVTRTKIDTWSAAEPGSEEALQAEAIVDNFAMYDAHQLPVLLAQKNQRNSLGGMIPDTRNNTSGDLYVERRPYELFNWLKDLNDNRLLNFLQWNYDRTRLASETLTAHRPNFENTIHFHFSKLALEGVIPDHAEQALKKGFANTKHLLAIDAFEAGIYGAVGLHYGTISSIGLHKEFDHQNMDENLPKIRKVLAHEFLHAIGAANAMDITYLLSETEAPQTWANEATVEHLVQAAYFGDPFTVEPNARSRDLGSYSVNRLLLHLVMTCGDIPIPLRAVTDAYFEPITGDKRYRRHLDGLLRQSYSNVLPELPPDKNIFEAIAVEHNSASRAEKLNVLDNWIYRISGDSTMLNSEMPSSKSDIILVREVVTEAD